jgi:toxin HigB-1
MDIKFRTKKMARTFNSDRELRKAYGDEQARTIQRRMAVLRAAPSLSDVSHLPPERRHELTGDRLGTFAVDLKHPYRLILVPNHDPIPRRADGGIDLEGITAVTVLEVEDYH